MVMFNSYVKLPKVILPINMVILWMEEILHHQKNGWNPINNGMFTTYQLVQDFATIHSILGEYRM